jgi:hypothetical protein
MSDTVMHTYWPKNGSVYSGDQSNINLESYDPSYAKLGSIRKVDGKSYKARLNASLSRQLYARNKFNAAINESSIDHINAFPLLRELVGAPAEVYFIEEAARTINVPSLNARIPERDAFKPQIGVQPLQEVDFTQVKYGEDNFDLKYNAAPFFHPSEDRLRGVIDPMNIDMQESQRALREGREILALFELTKLTDSGTDIADMEASTGGTHDNNPKTQITGIIRSHWKANQSILNWTFWNPVDYQRYETNDRVHAFQAGKDVSPSGVQPFTGIPGLMAVIDPLIPLGNVYFVDNQAFLKGVGPLQTEQWRRPENNADLGIARDYVQFLMMNPARYGLRTQIDLTTSADSVETQPATLEATKALLATPTTVSNPPTIG